MQLVTIPPCLNSPGSSPLSSDLGQVWNLKQDFRAFFSGPAGPAFSLTSAGDTGPLSLALCASGLCTPCSSSLQTLPCSLCMVGPGGPAHPPSLHGRRHAPSSALGSCVVFFLNYIGPEIVVCLSRSLTHVSLRSTFPTLCIPIASAILTPTEH